MYYCTSTLTSTLQRAVLILCWSEAASIWTDSIIDRMQNGSKMSPFKVPQILAVELFLGSGLLVLVLGTSNRPLLPRVGIVYDT